MRSLGLRHVALNVKDAQKSKDFYMRALGMKLEWEPDPDNVYLTSEGLDNLAIHKAQSEADPTRSTLDHIGIAVPEAQDVDEWYEHIKKIGAKIMKEPKTHRDGARSFYFADPDGIVVQVIHHPPITARTQDSAFEI